MNAINNRFSPPLSKVADHQNSGKPSSFLVALIAFVMAAQGAYSLYAGLAVQPYAYASIAWALIPFTAAVGLWLRRRWSQFFIHAFSVVIVVVWAWQFWNAVQMGTWLYDRASATVVGILITLPPVFVAVGASFVAYRLFSGRS